MLKAIECSYAGRKFRSRREARWAILFDRLDLDWRYEPEGYDLGSNVFYLPDFELHLGDGIRQWVEVKPEIYGYPPLGMLCEQSKQRGVVVGEPMLKATVLPCDCRGSFGGQETVTAWLIRISGADALTCQAASNAALSARWEHGEKPRRPRREGGRGPRAYTRPETLLSQPSSSGSDFGGLW